MSQRNSDLGGVYALTADVFADQFALDQAAAMAVALNIDGIIIGIGIAGAVADRVESLDHRVLLIKHLKIVGYMHTADNAKQSGPDTGRVERTVLNGKRNCFSL